LPDDTPLGELANVSKGVLDQATAQVMQIIERMT